MLAITALDLDAWASRQSARSDLPILARRLIHARPVAISHIDFPGDQSTDGGGWDGELVASGADPWVPAGSSFWELSCEASKSLAAKASRDFIKRTEATPADVRGGATFVFFTARRWPGKTRWQEARRREAAWADVRVLDAEGLVQWIEQAPSAMAWMQARLGRPTTDLCSPEDLWEDWASVTDPVLPLSIFDEALDENRNRLASFFGSGSDNVLDVAADTRGEAAAFAARLMIASDLPVSDRQRAVVARTPAGLQYLKSLDTPLTLLVPNAEVEGQLGVLATRAKILVAHDKSALDPTTGVCVEPLTWTAFSKLADALDLDGQGRERLDQESGRRISILRRRRSKVRGLRLPAWASQSQLARPLLGLALAGGWFWDSPGDRDVLTRLTGLPEEELEAAIKVLAAMEDAPIFSVAKAGGVISRPDAFNALRGSLTAGDVDRFVELALEVLVQPDPGLELEADKRWAANVFGKDRPHSGRLRTNMADSLTFLAAAGEPLLNGPHAAWAAQGLVRRLFQSDDPDIWLHVRDVLPALAEAAPDTFLKAIERDLAAEPDDRGVWRLIKPVEGPNGENLRTGVLWGLERLAWSPQLFGRVVSILATFAERPIRDNWVNKPMSSLAMLVHPIIPQTAALEASQVRALEALDSSHPTIAWTLALGIIDQRLSGGFYSARPRYRTDAIGHGGESRRPGVAGKAFELVLRRRHLSLGEVSTLIDKSPCFDGEALDRLWDVVGAWGEEAVDGDRATARDRVRQCAFWRVRKPAAGGGIPPDPRAREVFDALAPRDLLIRYKWLFRNAWVALEEDEDDEDLDRKAREARVDAAQTQALKEIWDGGGMARLAAFARIVDNPWFLAFRAFKDLPLDPIEVTCLLLDETLDGWVRRADFVGGFIAQLDPEIRTRLLADELVRWKHLGRPREALLLAAPAGSGTWALVDRLEPDEQDRFWRKTTAFIRDDAGALNRLCRELLGVHRARAAFARGEHDADDLEPSLIVDIIKQLAYGPPGPEEEDEPISGSSVESYLSALDRHGGKFEDDILRFEFIFCRHLDHTKRGIRALSETIAEDPKLFIQAVASCKRRDDGTEEDVDPGAVEALKQTAERSWHLLEHCNLGPGADPEGRVDPERFELWMKATIAGLEAVGRTRTGLRAAGKIVGRTRRESDGQWPDMALARALERWADDEFREGLFLGICNSRGAAWREADGGNSDRALAAKFNAWRQRVDFEAPRLASVFGDVAAWYERSAVQAEERAALRRKSPD